MLPIYGWGDPTELPVSENRCLIQPQAAGGLPQMMPFGGFLKRCHLLRVTSLNLKHPLIVKLCYLLLSCALKTENCQDANFVIETTSGSTSDTKLALGTMHDFQVVDCVSGLHYLPWTKHRYWTSHTHHVIHRPISPTFFPIISQIWWKFDLIHIQILMNKSLLNFAYHTFAVMACAKINSKIRARNRFGLEGNSHWIWILMEKALTHWGLVMRYNIGDLGQHWFR